MELMDAHLHTYRLTAPCVLCRSSAFKYAENNALGWRPIVDGEAEDYTFMNYREFDDTVTKVGSAMKATINCGTGTAIGMYAANSPEWMIAMKAVDFCGGMTVCHLHAPQVPPCAKSSASLSVVLVCIPSNHWSTSPAVRSRHEQLDLQVVCVRYCSTQRAGMRYQRNSGVEGWCSFVVLSLSLLICCSGIQIYRVTWYRRLK